ncbi:hypothetical protein [Psychrosphaera haliotis]|uniref:Uncharacterized protein n=1 Tax=Psychrosphaera haliotis TaxID=555083 RepID=A0A6N8FDI2_9GAMM|nr:hypothetical protein [Psychrosphaera haliotis]MUH72782.1 hypothetical protein [Psychrosphaera haliotis]
MKTLSNKEVSQVTGGIWVGAIVLLYEELFTAAIKEMFEGGMQALGELENRGPGTRP